MVNQLLQASGAMTWGGDSGGGRRLGFLKLYLFFSYFLLFNMDIYKNM